MDKRLHLGDLNIPFHHLGTIIEVMQSFGNTLHTISFQTEDVWLATVVFWSYEGQFLCRSICSRFPCNRKHMHCVLANHHFHLPSRRFPTAATTKFSDLRSKLQINLNTSTFKQPTLTLECWQILCLCHCSKHLVNRRSSKLPLLPCISLRWSTAALPGLLQPLHSPFP